ncbi:MAG: hypothetical protein K2I42_01665 [Anaeroplasmataceae bacterium]|nr:hypothetical protein [Anaeroplasmataceae bacterium]
MKSFKKACLWLVALVLSVVALASCGEKKASGAELAAKKVILTQDKSESVTDDFKVTAVVRGDDNVSYSVAWESNNAVASIGEYTEDGEVNADFKLVTIDYMHNLTDVQSVKLTATVENPDKSEKFVKEFNFKVPKFKETTIDEYDAAKAGAMVTVKGIIVAKEPYSASYKNTSVYIQDISGKGGYDAYRLACATQEAYDTDLAIGNTILVTGAKKLYSGLREFESSTYVLVSTDKVTPKDTDITEMIKTDPSQINLDLQCQLVHFDNLTVVSVGSDDKNGNWNIVVGDANDKTKQFTVRVNTYITPKTSDEYKAYKDLGITAGAVISVKGVLGWYNAAQLHPTNVNSITVVSQGSSGGNQEPDPAPVTPTIPEGAKVAQYTGTTTTNTDKIEGNLAATLGLEESIFTVDATKCVSGQYGNFPGLNKAGNIRLYGNNEKEGNTLTFTVAEGYKIEKIIIVLAETTIAEAVLAVYTTDAASLITAVNGVYTVNGNTVTLKNVTEGSKQIHIAKIGFVLSQTA